MIVDLSTDEDLMYLLQSGDHKALLVLYERHSEKVWSYLQKRVPREDAEDLFQDCFVRLIDKKSSWKGQPFVLWLFVLIRNTVSDHYRGKKVENRYLQKLIDSDDGNDPSTVVDEILTSMPEDKARLLKEFFEEGWSYKELAVKYEISDVSLRKRLSRALKLLKGSL